MLGEDSVLWWREFERHGAVGGWGVTSDFCCLVRNRVGQRWKNKIIFGKVKI